MTKFKKNYPYVFALVFIIPFIVLIMLGAGFSEDEEERPVDEGYVISDFYILADVSKDNIVSIKETITVDFKEESHGIYAYIPKKCVQEYNNQKKTYEARIKNINCNVLYEVNEGFDDVNIRLGDPDELVSGVVSYEISFDYYLGEDQYENEDIFYFNLIGDGWSGYIEKARFKVTFPDGEMQEVSTNEGTFNINNNTIEGEYNDVGAFSSLTILVKFPDGYFKGSSWLMEDYVQLIVYLSLVFLWSVLFIIFGRERSFVKITTQTCPSGFSPSRVALYYKGHVGYEDISMDILYLANHGYIEIEEDEEITFKKICDYEGNDDELKILFDTMFGKNEEITLSSLMIYFPQAVTLITKNYSDIRQKMYEKSGNILVLIGLAMSFLMGIYFIASMVSMKRILCFIIPFCIVIFVVLTFLMPKKKLEAAKICWEVKSFRKYIKDTKLDELKEKLNSDSKYYFDILPYAYVLGLETTWKGFADDLDTTVRYYNYDPYGYWYMSNMMRDEVHTTELKHYSSSEGSSFSGGGSSGSGSGGGGGGRW